MSVVLKPSQAPFALDEDKAANQPSPTSLRPELGSFAGRLSRAMSRSPLPAPGSALGSTKGVPQVDLLALEAMSLQQARVACAPRFWEAADLLAGRLNIPEERDLDVEITKDAASKQSPDERRDHPTLYAPDVIYVPPALAPRRTLQPTCEGQPAGAPQTATPAPVRKRAATPPPLKSPAKADVQASERAAQKPAPSLGAPSPPTTRAVAAQQAAAGTTAEHKPATSDSESLESAAARANAPSPIKKTIVPAAAPSTLRADKAAAQRVVPRVNEQVQGAGAPPPAAHVAAPALPPSRTVTVPTLHPPTNPSLLDAADELTLSHVHWKPGEARVSVQTDAGALSLHVRVKDGVADVAASGAPAKQLAEKSKELHAQLAKDGLMLGRFAAVDQHNLAAAASALDEHEAESTSCQEPDEDDGTGSAEADGKRRLSGERRHLRPSRRVHVKA